MTEAEKTAATVTKVARETRAKVAEKTNEAFDAFAMQKVEMPEAFREMTEKSVKQAKDSYEKLRVAAEEATDMIEDQFETTRSGLVELNTKAVLAAKANSDAAFKFMTEVITAKTFSDVISLQSSYARSQFELMTAQAKEMQELLTKLGTEVSQPVKDVFEKTMKQAKAA